MTPTQDISLPESWHGFENFVPVESTQGWVWRGGNEAGKVAYLKQHREVGSFEREWRALTLIKDLDVGPRILAVDPSHRSILMACAGTAYDERRVSLAVARQCVDTLNILHRCPVPGDEMPIEHALLMRWRRLQRRLGDHCSRELSAWIESRLASLPKVPRSLVHRDVRPSHWFFDGGKARLIDFGQARVDAVLFDAIPFYTQQYPQVISAAVQDYFEVEYGQTVAESVDVFVAIYLCGTIERLIYHQDQCELGRASQLCASLKQWSSAPIDFDEVMAKKEGNRE